MTPGASLTVYTNEVDITGLTLTATNILKITATRAGVSAATNDILLKHGWIRWDPSTT